MAQFYDLLSGQLVSFNGVLSVANGGTGSATQNFVDLSSSQSVDGTKTFTGRLNAVGTLNETTTTAGVNIGIQGGTPRLLLALASNTNWEIDNSAGLLRIFQPLNTQITLNSTGVLTLGANSNSPSISQTRNNSSAGNSFALSAQGGLSGGTNLNGGNLTLKSGISTGTGSSNITFSTSGGGVTGTADNAITVQATIDGTGNLFPAANVTQNLGSTSKYWLNLYAQTLNLNSTASLTGAVAGAINTTALFGLAAASATPTHSLTLGSTATGIAYYNTVDQTTNYERGLYQWTSNEFRFATQAAGTGTIRNIKLLAGTTSLVVAPNADTSGAFQFNRSSGTTNGLLAIFSGTFNGGGVQSVLSIAPTINQSSTAGYTALLINPTETTTGSGTKLLLDLQVGGTSKVSVRNDGVWFPVQAATASAPTYTKGGVYYDTTLNKLRIGGATAWETVTST